MMTVPHILLFTDADVFAGTERHMLDLAVSLAGEGVQPRVACPFPSPLASKAAAAGIDAVVVQKGGLIDRAAVRTLRKLLRRGEVDLIHAHNGRTALQAALAVRLAGAGRLVVTQHFLEPANASRPGLKGVISRVAHRWVNGRKDHAIAISQAVRRAMLQRGELPDGRITVVPNGIADPQQEQATLDTAAIRQQLGIPAASPLIVTVGRLEREKDIRSLVEAMATVTKAFPGAVCVVAGEGSERQYLNQRIEQLGLGQSVQLLGFRSDAMSIIAAGDMFVLPSIAEGFGLVLVEAMALGKPVIATQTGGPMEVVAEGQTGLLVPPGDPRALAQAICALLDDPHRRRTLGENGRARFLDRFTAQRMARETLSVYRQVLGLPEVDSQRARVTPNGVAAPGGADRAQGKPGQSLP